MMFTKQHYEVLAELLKKSYCLDVFIENLIRMLKTDNPKFDETKFRKAITM
jgi:hypothetical protein